MADVRPSKFPPAEHTKHLRDAEQLLYKACPHLPANWFALYGVHWAGPQPSGAIEGECDFVFIGPEIGLVVVEVKGGGVGSDGGAWYSVDRHRVRHPIKNPAVQAQKGRFALMNYLHDCGRGALIGGHCTAHMVCLPNMFKRDMPPLPELPPALVIDGDDLSRLADVLRECRRFLYPSEPKVVLSQEACRTIADTLRPASFEVTSRWSPHIFQQRFEIRKLTDEQKNALEMISDNKKISLSGPAGSGKTIAALHQAQRAVSNGRRTFIVVPTKGLRHYYSSVLSSDLVKVVLPEAINTDNICDTSAFIILDEAQDLPLGLVDNVSRYCDGNESSVLVVHDSNQKLERNRLIIPKGFACATFKKILRSTSQIAELASRFYLNSASPPEIVGPSGLPVNEVPVKDKAEIPAAVSNLILGLVEKDDFSFRDIVVLFGNSNGKFLREGGKSFNGIKYRNAANVWGEACDDARCIACCGVREFRGMESAVVILCEVDDLLEQQLIEGAYVGMSRAQHLLAIVGLAGTLQRIRSTDTNSIAKERQKVTVRTVERNRGAERLSRLVSPGAFCLGKVTGVERAGVFIDLIGLKCYGLLPRLRITQDNSLDLNAQYTKGMEVNVVVESIGTDGVVLALPSSRTGGMNVRPGKIHR